MRRSQAKIIESILEVCKEPSGKTKIVYQVGLNFSNATRYLSQLVESGLLEVSDTPKVLYKITPKGLVLLENIKSINAMIGNNKH